MKKKQKTKTMKAWAILVEKPVTEVQFAAYFNDPDCCNHAETQTLAIYDTKDSARGDLPMEGHIIVPCTITYQLVPRE